MTIINYDFVMDLVNDSMEPCISIYLSTEAAREGNFHKLEIKYKNKLSEVSKTLKKDWDYREAEIDELLEPAYELIDDINFWQHHEKGIAIFINESKFDYLRFNTKIKDQAKVSKHFYVIPLLFERLTNSQYYILALSKHSNKFFKADSNTITRLKEFEVDESLKDYVGYDGESRNSQHHSHNVSASNTVFHGKGNVQPDEKQDLYKVLKKVDNSIQKAFKNEDTPLILYCDETLYHFYKEINSSNNLFDKFINGNPENINENDIQEKTWEVIEKNVNNKKQEIIDNFMELKGTSRTSLDIKLITRNAYYSRVDSLLINGNRELEGYFDQKKNKVYMIKNGKETYDLYNYAAILTLQNGGEVFVLKEDIPEGINIESINRY